MANILLTKNDSHYSKYIVDGLTDFALLIVQGENFISGIFGEHWNGTKAKAWSDHDLVTKKDLERFVEDKSESMGAAGLRFVWAKADSENVFYECNKEDIPEDATTEQEKFLVISVDEYGDKSISENPIWDKFTLTKEIKELSENVSKLESYWYYKDSSRIPEIYKTKTGFEIRRLHKTWKIYDVDNTFVFNANTQKQILDDLQAEKLAAGDELAVITTHEMIDKIYSMI